MKKYQSTIIIIATLLLGIGLLVYPSFSDWWNERHQSVAIAGYDDAVAAQDDTTNEEMLAAAEAYNAQLLQDREDETLMLGYLTDDQIAEYNSLLDVTGTGIMGYVRIPKIDVELPIYHGTDESVLQIAAGHIEGTSLPVGGTGTHAVISGHRGLPSAKLFTDIDSLGIGDIFIITCLNRKITYEVDQILTVLPEETEELAIDPDQDYCTLVTCTPYGINSHRLLVRGHRIANLLEDDIKTIQIEIPERELSWQEKLQNIILPYALILAAGFFGLAMILPVRKNSSRYDAHGERYGSRYEDPRAKDDWDERKRRMDARKNDPSLYGKDNEESDENQDIEFYDDDEEFYDEDEPQ